MSENMDKHSNEFLKCTNCDHFVSLHLENGCTFVESISNNTKEKKICDCKYKN